MQAYILEGPGRESYTSQKHVIDFFMTLAEPKSYQIHHDKTEGSVKVPRAALPEREHMVSSLSNGDIVIVPYLIGLGLSEKDAGDFVERVCIQGAKIKVLTDTVEICTPADFDKLRTTFNRQRNAMYQRRAYSTRRNHI